jgi:hypothetical protein
MATHYNIENLEEPYHLIINYNPEQYHAAASRVTENLMLSDGSFVCKLQTTDIIGNFGNFSSLIDFPAFNFDIFDSVYLTYRSNLTEQLCSLIVASTLRKFSFTKGVPKLPKAAFKFDANTYQKQLVTVSLDHLKFRMIKRFLNSINKVYTVIEYNDCVDWAHENLPNASPNMMESKYDYRSLFVNYSEVTDFLNGYIGKVY